MDKIKYYIEKYIYIIYLLIILCLTFCLIYLLLFKNNKNKETISSIEPEKSEKSEQSEDTDKKIKIDIKGFVINPGVYELNSDDRVIDAINIAGGLSENAETSYINLSKILKDEMIIIIYSKDEIEKYMNTKEKIIYIEHECECADNINEACITEQDIVNTTKNVDYENELISINSDDIEELQKLPGIGESKAKSIIEYRKNNGNFVDLLDIMNVSGIGESVYTKIKDNIKL